MSNIKQTTSLRNYQVGVAKILELDATQDFMTELLDELHENVSKDELGDDAAISFNGEIEKIKGKYEEFLQFTGALDLTYYTHDIITNEVMTDRLEQEVKCLLLTKEVGQKLQMEDEIEIELNGEEYDLYFLDEDDCFNIKDVLHEYIYLNKNNYPKQATESPAED
ncbi:MAG: hypothetical protein CME70_03580 [Halobacteriovorax sp.]|nr:hypothetical protein [Halobacteriovorax sp.]|tara:strand:+ start:207236 stop:207733 length:498 start_codon:yes stop_codon:yes gene_type:complete